MRSLLLACLASLVLACTAAASTTQESLLQDDPLIVHHASAEQLDDVFAVLKALGVDRVRVSVFWELVAPRPNSSRKPSFGEQGADWPSSYPEANWARYDRIALSAARHGIGLLFTVTGPGPLWATGGKSEGLAVYKPKAREFAAFVEAVGHRYSGAWTIPAPSAPPQQAPGLLPGLPIQIGTPAQGSQAQADTVLPRVDHWSIWNEPNFPSWLKPVYKGTRLPVKGHRVPAAPHRYRQLVDAAWRGLAQSGHGSDVVLIGETAPRGGTLHPTVFIRELYCVDSHYRAFRGAAARARGCPATRSGRAGFYAAHPGLFENDGWAHHGYSLDNRPRWRPPTWRDRSLKRIPLGSTNRLTRLLDRVQFAWGSSGPSDIWITEYGYQTLPDPYTGIPLERQAQWTSWAEHVAYRYPRIAGFTQFLLNDAGPIDSFDSDDWRYWGSWQSGLATAAGKPKPAFEEYPVPIHISPTRPRRGRSVRVWAAFRPPADGAQLLAEVQALEGSSFRAVKQVTVGNPKGYLDTRVQVPSSTSLRVAWIDLSTGATGVSRTVPIRVR